MNARIETHLDREIEQYGAEKMDTCMQCGNCSASCPLSTGATTFPRKIYRYIQLGMRDKLLESPEPWLCYYCGECNDDCTQGANPAETMMAARRWLTAQYDITGLAKKFYLSAKWELGTFLVLFLLVVLWFLVGHGPVITDHMAVNSFAPVGMIEAADLLLVVMLGGLLLVNAFRMCKYVLQGEKLPMRMAAAGLKAFIVNFFTQRRWRGCAEENRLWRNHFVLVLGYVTMLLLVIVFIRWFQVDDTSWHFTSVFGYFSTVTILGGTGFMLYGRYKKKARMHQHSHLSDWLFLYLLFATALTGIIMHLLRIAGFPLATYLTYVIHLAIAIPMLIIEVPFGKWAHLFYRPLAIALTEVKEKVEAEHTIDLEVINEKISNVFMTCAQCGTCTSVCPESKVTVYNPRRLMRGLGMHIETGEDVDRSIWHCTTCNYCGETCPRGIKVYDLVHAVRAVCLSGGHLPAQLKVPLENLKESGNPFEREGNARAAYHQNHGKAVTINRVEFHLYTCCLTVKNSASQATGGLRELFDVAGVRYNIAGPGENCCGDLAYQLGDETTFNKLSNENIEIFRSMGVRELVTDSAHCYDMMKNEYTKRMPELKVTHYTEKLAQLIKQRVIVPKIPVNKVITYHDPCYLGRHNGVYDAPREVLKAIPGADFVEMCCVKQKSICCGGGGGGLWYNEDKEQELGQIRVNYALEMGASVLVTACPNCVVMLSQAVEHLGMAHRLQIVDLAEFLYESIEH